MVQSVCFNSQSFSKAICELYRNVTSVTNVRLKAHQATCYSMLCLGSFTSVIVTLLVEWVIAG